MCLKEIKKKVHITKKALKIFRKSSSCSKNGSITLQI